jgi:hypothetical protein
MKSNRDFLEKYLYPPGEFPNAYDVYILYRKRVNEEQIICCFSDVCEAHNAKNIMNREKDGWEYYCIESDCTDRDIAIKIE